MPLKSQRGATLVETALMLPIVIVGILLIIWLAVFFSSSASFETALQNAGRLATRAERKNVGVEMIKPVHDWNASGGDLTADLEPLMTVGVDRMSASDFLNSYGVGVFGAGGFRFADLPPEYSYTMIYLKEALTQAIGETVFFPCDPDSSEGSAPRTGPGCVACKLLNPVTYDETPWDTGADPPRQAFTLDCKYQPHNFLLSPVFRIISVLSGGNWEPRIIIRRTQVFDWDSSDGRQY